MKKIPPGCMLPGRGASDHLIVFRLISEIKLKLRTTNVRDYLRIKHYVDLATRIYMNDLRISYKKG